MGFTKADALKILKLMISDYEKLLSLSGEPDADSLVGLMGERDEILGRIKERDKIFSEDSFRVLKDDPEVAGLIEGLKKIISGAIASNEKGIDTLNARKLDIVSGMGQLADGKKITNGYAVGRSDKKGIVSIRE